MHETTANVPCREGAGKALGILGPLAEVSAFYVASQQIRRLMCSELRLAATCQCLCSWNESSLYLT